MEASRPGLEQRLRDLEKICRDHGLKLTHQRMEIFRELASSSEHPSAEKIYKRLLSKFPTLSLDTVYRTLITFEKIGLIARVQAERRFSTTG